MGAARQALIAEKRAFYSRLLRALDDGIDKADSVVDLKSAVDEAANKSTARTLAARLDEAHYACAESLKEIHRLIPELMILGGHSIGVMASVVSIRIGEHARGAASRESFAVAHAELITLMHESVNPDGEPSEDEIRERVDPWVGALDQSRLDKYRKSFEAAYPEGC
ncbi:hypothetical protein [Micromonospora chalcea]|uniref:hypothetical protein n=1 Tax=Micromonospora chalcea TaxID=1874 RepID=UPI0037CA8231